VAGRELIGQEVNAPVLVWARGRRREDPQAGGELPAASDADREPFFAIQAEHAFIGASPLQISSGDCFLKNGNDT
jgi:hypothetical protein